MLGRHPVTSLQKAEDAPAVSADAFVFNAVSTVRGITFHLLDERLGRAVAEDTVRRTIERLTAKSFALSIARERWGGMTNSQRLEWLLAESQTLPLIGADDVVFLRSRRSK